MDDQDKNLASQAAKLTGGTALALVNPLLAVPWELGFMLYGSFAERRRDKVKEWVDFFVQHSATFSDRIVGDPSFQDAFINSFEKYLRERSEEKRRAMLGVFLGFSKSGNLEEFPLERYYSVIDSISPAATRMLPEVEGGIKDELGYYQASEGGKDVAAEKLEGLQELIALNILMVDPAPRFVKVAPCVKLTWFGNSFSHFLKGNLPRA